jgi:F-type H+-transporting ATPase subunit b
MKASQKEAEEMIAQAKARAQQMKEENERQLQADAERIKAAAARDIEQERRKALEDVRRHVADLALRVAEKVVERSLTDADHKRLADEALAAVARDYEKA